MTRITIAAALASALLTAACSVDVGGTAFVNDKSATVHAGTSVPVLGPDGRCTADASLNPTSGRAPAQAVVLGIGECDLVRIKGQPVDVLIGESGKGQREVQVLYQEPTGKKLYLFTDNRLTRIVE
ncbi:hypothetical protein QNA08_15805 [Chelatococcus sp. SYSU_G07232]|uniref:Lipoprotein n=1 Tax=Chelatococcus albus TaxID=3047466 RepID=A0ABT7AJZ5_9HYPH|nr:hypothetical protein [Chelatococcus sp. SYSU_G07232]MDJ1159689.1 hypothetical protein [Chelatococcus sp. SYSU_G07232]